MPKTNEILCGNHLDILKEYPDGFFDMVLTSPPYDNLRDYEGYTFEFEPLAHELYRVLKDGGVCVWVVNDATVNGSETLTSFKQAIYFKDVVGFNVHDTMIYKANGTGAKGSNLSYWQAFEYMLVLAKGKPLTVNRIADKKSIWSGTKSWSSGKTKDRGNRSACQHVNAKISIRDNVWIYNVATHLASENIAFQHPAIFPEKLAEDHILSWSNPGDIVLDPMCGSGTTCKMAVKHQRQYVGIDCAEKYCQIAEERIRKFTQQTNMFDMAGYNKALHVSANSRAT